MCNHRFPWYIETDAARYVMATFCGDELTEWRECVETRLRMCPSHRGVYFKVLAKSFDKLRAAYRAACVVSAAA